MPNDPTRDAQLRSLEARDDTAGNIGATEGAAKPMADPRKPTGWTVRIQSSHMVIVLAGDWIVRQTGVTANVAKYLLQSETSRTLMFDTTSLGHWDSALIVFLWDLQAEAARFEIAFDPSGLPEPARQLLALASVQVAPKATPAAQRRASRLDRTPRDHRVGRRLSRSPGSSAIPCCARGPLSVAAGDCVASTWWIARGKPGLPRVPIVTVVNVLVGGILAFVGAAQLRRFGAGIFVADLVGVAVVREMAAVMTAIIMSGRTGGAYAAQIATMQGNEEIDALQVAGIPVFDYLVLPRITALTCMMPILYLYGCVVGIIGGVAVAWLTLQLNSITFPRRDAHGGRPSISFVLGLSKSVVFGAVIAFAGCRIGLRSGRSAAEVGRAATTAVVVGIVCVIALDALFAVCANRFGI